MTPKLHDPSVTLLEALDELEFALVKRATLRRRTGPTTFREYCGRQRDLQPFIEQMACKLKITREELPDRWEQLVRLIVDGDRRALLGRDYEELDFPAGAKPSFTSEGLLQIVTINVGRAEGRKTYKIHKKFAIDRSPVLKRAFTGNFIEAETQSIELEDIEHEVFDLFVQWLYTSEIHRKGSKLPGGDLLIKLWVLADRLLVPKLQNLAICAIEHKMMKEEQVVRTDQARYIYENTVPGSQLRRLIVDQCSNLHKEAFDVEHTLDDYPKEMLFDLVAVLLNCRSGVPRSMVDLAQFFVDDGEANLRPHGHVSDWTGHTLHPLHTCI